MWNELVSYDQCVIHLSVLSAICTSRYTSESLIHVSTSSNPTPGILINRPNGSDVYKGVPKDYTGEVSVTMQIFVQIKALE